MQMRAPILSKAPELWTSLRNRSGTWNRKGITAAVVTAICYYVIARIGIAWDQPTSIATFWPSSGVTAGAMIAFGKYGRKTLAGSEFLAVTTAAMRGGVAFGPACVLGIGDTLGSLFVAIIAERLAGKELDLGRLPHLVAFVFAAVSGPLAAGIPVAAALELFGISGDGFSADWVAWLHADFVGNLTFAPLVLVLPRLLEERGSILLHLEGLLALALLSGSAFAIYADLLPVVDTHPAVIKLLPTSLFLFPLIIWIAARLPAYYSSAAVFSVATVIIYCSTHGLGRFGVPTTAEADRVLAAEISMVTFALATLAVGALFGERERAERSLRVANEKLSRLSSELEIRVLDRTRELSVANERLLGEADVRERMTHELSQSEAWLRTAQRVAGVGSFSIGRDPSAGAHWSEEALRIVGLERSAPAATVDNFVSQLVCPDDRDKVKKALDVALDVRQPSSIEYRIRRADGSERTVLTALEPQSDSAGAPMILCTALDVTERNEAEQKIAQYRNDLLHMVRVATAGELATVMAHEVNQPLSAISHTASALIRLDAAGRLDPGEMSENLSEIAAQAQRASAIIRHIRQFVQKRTVAAKRIAMDDVVRDVLAMIEPVARRLDVRIEYVNTGKPAVVIGEEVQIGQLLVNLVRNAVDAVAGQPAGQRTVSIVVAATDDEVAVSVEDCGPGFGEEAQARMFEPFFTTKGDGLGMGLPIARTIAEAHSGKLEITDRRDGPGVAARVTFPAARKGNEQTE